MAQFADIFPLEHSENGPQVAACAPAATIAAQVNNPHQWIVASAFHRAFDASEDLQIHGVEHIGAIQCNVSDWPFAFVKNRV